MIRARVAAGTAPASDPPAGSLTHRLTLLLHRPRLALGALLLLALLVRLPGVLLSPGYDVRDYKVWARITSEAGIGGVYSAEYPSGTPWLNYPPVHPYVLRATAWLYQQINPDGDWRGQDLAALLKLTPVLAELVIGVLIFRFLRPRSTETLALLGAAAFLLNPAVIWNTSYWGGIDAFHTLFLTAALFAAAGGHHIRAWPLAVLAVGAKLLAAPGALALIPPALRPAPGHSPQHPGHRDRAHRTANSSAASHRGTTFPPATQSHSQVRSGPHSSETPIDTGAPSGRTARRRDTTPQPVAVRAHTVSLAALAATIMALLLAAPVIVRGELDDMVSAMFRNLGSQAVVSANAHNLWWLLTRGDGWRRDTLILVASLDYRTTGLILFGLVTAYILIRFWPRAHDTVALLSTAAFLTYALFFLTTEVHENWNLAMYAPLAVLAVLQPRYRRLTLLLALTTLANLAIEDPPLREAFGSASDTPARVLSQINSAAGCLLFAWWLRLLHLPAQMPHNS